MKTVKNTFGVNCKTLMAIICIALFSGVAMSAAAKGKPGPGADLATIYIQYLYDADYEPYAAIGGAQSCEDKLNADSTIIGCNHDGGGFTFEGPIFAWVNDHQTCFDSVDGAGYTKGTIQLLLNTDGSAEAVFRFGGKGADGVDEVLYVLRAFADQWEGQFPLLASGDSATMLSDRWTLDAANRRQAKDAGDCLAMPAQADPYYIGVTVSRD